MLKKIIIGLAGFLLVFGLSAPAWATQTRFADTVDLGVQETFRDDVLVFGGTVVSSGKIEGDLIVLGGDITISGEVAQDVTVIGGTVKIEGKVNDDVNVVGGQINLAGEVTNNVLALGGTLLVSPSGSIGGDLQAYGGNVEVSGQIDGKLTGKTASTILKGKVGGDVDIASSDIKLTNSAQIGGNLNYTSSEAATIQSGSLIAGKVSHSIPPEPSAAASVLSTILSALAFVLLTVVIALLFPKHLQAVAEELNQGFWPSLLVGLFTLIIVPLVVLFLVATVIGAPLGVVLVILYGLAVYLSKIGVALLLGDRILRLIDKKNEPSVVWACFFGIVVLLVLFQIPLVGAVINFLTILFGLGALALWVRKVYAEARKKKTA